VTHGTVIRLALPMMLAYLSTPLVGAVGTAVVGQLGQAALIGGIAVAAVVFDVLFSTFNFLRGATTGMTAQAVGAGDPVEQQSVLFRALVVALSAALLLVVLQRPLAALGVAAMDVSGPVAEACLRYFFVRIWSAPFVLVNYAVLGWVIGRGEATSGLLLQTLLNGVNISLSILFVLGWHWGVEGAAWASVLAEALTAAAGLGLAAWRIAGAPKPSRAYVFDPARLKRMLGVNSDMMIRSFSLLFAFAFFTREGVGFGEIVLAANAVLMHFFLVSSYFLDGFATAAEQLAGRAVGARFRPAFEQAVRLTTVWGLATAILLTGLSFLCGAALVDVMSTSPDVRTAAYRYLPWAALTPLVAAIAFQMDGIFIGATWSRDMRNMMLLSVLVYLAAVLVLTPCFGNDGLWAALLIFLGARSVAFHWRMRRLLPRTFPAQA
jgi:putative MATE family efflux protein